MGGSSQQWKLKLDAGWLEAMGGARQAVIDLGIEALDRVKRKTPVDTGHAQNNWIVSIGALDTADTMSKPPAKGAKEADSFAARNSAALAAYPTDSFPVVNLQNNLPYALALEYGHSKQAPGGMVAMTEAEISAAMAEGIDILPQDIEI